MNYLFKIQTMGEVFKCSNFDEELSNAYPFKLTNTEYMFESSQCFIPYWYSENSKEISKRIKKKIKKQNN